MAYEKKKEMGKRPDVAVKAKGEEKSSKMAAKKMPATAAKKSMYKKKM